MKVIKPISVDSSVLFSSNVPEPDPSAGEVEYVPVDQGGGTIGDSFVIGGQFTDSGWVIGADYDESGNFYVAAYEGTAASGPVIVYKFDQSFNYINKTTVSRSYQGDTQFCISPRYQQYTRFILCSSQGSDPCVAQVYLSEFTGAAASLTSAIEIDSAISGDVNTLRSITHYESGTPNILRLTVLYYGSGNIRCASIDSASTLVHDNYAGAIAGENVISGGAYCVSIDVSGGKFLIFSRNTNSNINYINEYNSTFSVRQSSNQVQRLNNDCVYGMYTGSKYVLMSDPVIGSFGGDYANFTAYNVKTNYQYGEVDQGDPVPAGSIFVKSSVHRKYQAAVDTLLDPLEGVLTVPPEWVDIGPTNRYSPFDGVLGNPATYQDEIDYVINSPSIINSVSGFNVYGANEITITQKDSSGNIVYQKEIPMRDNSQVTDWYQYYFSPIIEINQFTVTDLLPYANSSIEVAIKGTGTVSVGELVIGSQAQIGETNYGSSLQLLDFSRKERDEFGNFDVIRRGTSKLVNYDVSIPKSRINYVFKTLSDLSTIPCVWVGVDDLNDVTTVYGYYKDSTLNIDAPTMCSATISVEGLV